MENRKEGQGEEELLEMKQRNGDGQLDEPPVLEEIIPFNTLPIQSIWVSQEG